MLLITFVLWQTRAPAPRVDLTLFRDRRFSGGTLSMTLLQFVLYGPLFTLPLYLQGVRGNDAFGTGLRLIPMVAGILIAAAASKPVIKRIGASVGTVIGMLITAVDLLLRARLTPETGMIWIGPGLTGFGLGAAVAMTSAMDAVLGSLPADAVGAGSAVMNTIRQLAGALGVAVLGSLLYSTCKAGLDPAPSLVSSRQGRHDRIAAQRDHDYGAGADLTGASGDRTGRGGRARVALQSQVANFSSHPGSGDAPLRGEGL